MKKTKKTQRGLTYYQPELYTDDGTNIDWNLPQELHSFQVFLTKEDVEIFMEHLNYSSDEYTIMEYHDYEIDGITVLDCDGNVVEMYDEE